ncbi:3-methyladenine DNA glycosylase/8-oxoguanine DNA glycosylase [Mycobacteroides abscessus subsp. abscessus]|nr:3-methyladenine DNA glycosylase/8-oxoguanine DNA glycosylase [Mycobacteroides abscessus subsp. abscessus]
MLRTGRVFEALVPAVLEQKVHTRSARMSWRKLVCRYGEPAPGPAPAGLLLPPDADTWRRVPSWVFHRANVGPQRAQTIVRAAAVADAAPSATPTLSRSAITTWPRSSAGRCSVAPSTTTAWSSIWNRYGRTVIGWCDCWR